MRAQEISRHWGELSRLRGLLVAVAEMAAQRAALAVKDAEEKYLAASNEVEIAQDGWREQLNMSAFDPALLQAWRTQVSRTTGSAAMAALALGEAESRLSRDREAWFTALRSYERVGLRHKAMRLAARRKREDHAMMDVADLLAQNAALPR